MNGWRARIGVIVPSTNTVVETEYWKTIPEGVSVHAARLKLTKTTPETLKRMTEEVERAADMLATAMVDVIVFACTSGSFVGGMKWEKNLTQKIEKVSGVKAITTAGAVVSALKTLKLKNIAMVTPYIKELHELEVDFMESNGISILHSSNLGMSRNVDIGKLMPQTAYRMARDTYHADIDGMFISCTDFRTVEIINVLENSLNVPVVTSNQASIYAALRNCGVNEHIADYGMLLEE